MRLFSSSSSCPRASVFARIALSLAGAFVVFAPGAALAAGSVVVQGPEVSVTSEDLQADVQRIPPEMRADILKQPRLVEQMAMNLYVRRVMAEHARRMELDKQQPWQASERIARDKVLSDAYLARVDALNAPNEQAIEAQARAIYQAQPERFKHDDQVRVRHILLAGSDEAVQVSARALAQALRGGSDFAAAARQQSIDKNSASKGGDLGYFSRGTMVPAFEEAAFALRNVGDVSDPVVTQFGTHVIRLDGRKAAGVPSFADVRAMLMDEVRSKVVQDARASAAEGLRAQAQLQPQAVEAFMEQAAAADSARSKSQ